MTMHIMPVYYTTTGKSKAKKKFASSQQKQEHERLQAEWEALKKSYVGKPVEGRVVRKYSLSIPKGRDTNHIPSRSSGVGTAVKNDIPQYTGTKMLGIGVLHKSNAVPVFSEEEAVDISKMRRG
jgi:hypothetical protein